MRPVTLSEAARLFSGRVTLGALRKAKYRYDTFPNPTNNSTNGMPSLYDPDEIERFLDWRDAHLPSKRDYFLRGERLRT